MSGPVDRVDTASEPLAPAPTPVLEVRPEPRRRRRRDPGPPGAAPARARRTIGAWCFLDHFRAERPDDPPVDDRPAPAHRPADGDLAARRRDAAHRQPRLRAADPPRPAEPHERRARRRPRRGRSALRPGRARRAAVGRATRGDPPRRGGLRAPRRPAAGRAALGRGGPSSWAPSATSRSPARADTPLLGADLAFDGAIEVPLVHAYEHGLVVLDGAVTIGDDHRRA